MDQNKIIPSLWFSTEGGNISEVIDYYKNIFGSDFEDGDIVPLGKQQTANNGSHPRTHAIPHWIYHDKE